MTGPLDLHLRFRHVIGREIMETDFVLCSRSEWTADPRSRDSSWAVASINGELVAACSLCWPAGSSSRLIDAYRRFDRECVARGM
jgi:hypothetical protein